MQLTQARLKELLHYDPETGIFTRLKSLSHNALAGSPAGGIHKHLGYVHISVDGKKYYGHRLATLYMTGAWPVAEVDHRNGLRSDNRWSNLRQATDAENRQNQHVARSDSQTGVVGVRRRGNCKHSAKIKVGGVDVYLGTFPTLDSARAAYIAAKAIHHPFSAA